MGAIVKRGRKFYLQFFDADGKRRMIAAKGATSRDHAKGMLNAIERNIMEGKVGVPKPAPVDPEAERRRAVTVQEIGEVFTTRYSSPRIKNPADYRMEAKSVLTVRVYPTLGARPAAEVTQLEVDNLRDALAEDYAEQSVTNTLNTLSKLYGWARKQKLIDCDNPVKGVERHRSTTTRKIEAEKYLTKAEASSLLAYAEEHVPDLHPMISFCLLSGARKGEAFGLRWCDLDFDRKQITIAHSYELAPKSGEPRHVPLHNALATTLRQWKERCPVTPAGLVFPVEGRMGRSEETLGLGDVMKESIKREPPKVWHSLRHSFASHLVMSGANILTVRDLMGHSDIETTMIYAHLAPDYMAADVARLNFAAALPANVTPISAASA